MSRATTIRASASIAACVAAAIAIAALAPAATAFYGPAQIVSASTARQEQGDDATSFVSLSADGRYAVFETRASNLFADDDPDPVFTELGMPVATDRRGGIFRREMATGALETVADGDLVAESDGRLLLAGAHHPSISGNGRFVVFATANRLVPADSDVPERHVDVYVRDMHLPRCSPLPGCTPNPYTLVSARDGGDVPFTYATPAGGAPPAGAVGSDVWPGSSISGDGRRVVLRTADVASDAPGAPTAAAGAPTTGERQLLVRDLDAKSTVLLTRNALDQPSPGAPAGGARGPAVISGDGTAVGWTGFQAQAQTRFQPGELGTRTVNYYLWRRIADGPAAPTRRVTGFVDVDDPACAPDQQVQRGDASQRGPCYGPLVTEEALRANIAGTNMALSHDGYEVAYLAGEAFRADPVGGIGLDLFTTSMAPGQTRKGATRELTREGQGDAAASQQIDSVSMSGDGRHVVIASARVRFVLPSPRPIGRFRPTSSVRELYVIDRAADTIERAVRAPGGGDPDAEVEASASIAAGTLRVAFVSSAGNLFFGDANGRADAFAIDPQPEPDAEAPPIPDPELPPEVVDDPDEPEPPEIAVRALKATRTGELTLEVTTPAAGRLAVRIRGRLPGKDGKRNAKAPIRQLATASGKASKAGKVKIKVRLDAVARKSLRRARALSVAARVTFTATAATTPVVASLRVRFVVVKKRKSKTKSTTA